MTIEYRKPYTLEDLEEALTDVLDGQDEHDIKAMTGLPDDRCVEIRKLCDEVMAELHYKKY